MHQAGGRGGRGRTRTMSAPETRTKGAPSMPTLGAPRERWHRTAGPNRKTGFASHTEYLGSRTPRRHRARHLPARGGGVLSAGRARSARRRSLGRRGRGLRGSPHPARQPRPRVDHGTRRHRDGRSARENPSGIAPGGSPAGVAGAPASSTTPSGLRPDPRFRLGMPHAPAMRMQTETRHPVGAGKPLRACSARASSSRMRITMPCRRRSPDPSRKRKLPNVDT
jgi:hypothetical protein